MERGRQVVAEEGSWGPLWAVAADVTQADDCKRSPWATGCASLAAWSSDWTPSPSSHPCGDNVVKIKYEFQNVCDFCDERQSAWLLILVQKDNGKVLEKRLYNFIYMSWELVLKSWSVAWEIVVGHLNYWKLYSCWVTKYADWVELHQTKHQRQGFIFPWEELW